MKPIQELLALTVPQRWSARELRDDICKDRPNKNHRWKPSVMRVSNMLKLAARYGKIVVRRKFEDDRLIVWYEGPPESFDDIRRRA